jgi:hypothetical protein
MATSISSISPEFFKRVARELGVDPRINMAQLRRGMYVEMEHKATIKKFAPTADVVEFAISVAADHLRENPNYYNLLDKMGL